MKSMKILMSHYGRIVANKDGSIPWFDKNTQEINLFKLQTLSGPKSVIMGYNTYMNMNKSLNYRMNYVVDNKTSNYAYHLQKENVIFLKDRPVIDKGCIIGGPKLISQYMQDPSILYAVNFMFYLTEYYEIENFEKIDGDRSESMKYILQNIKYVDTVFEDEFIHPSLKKCKYKVNFYKLF